MQVFSRRSDCSSVCLFVIKTPQTAYILHPSTFIIQSSSFNLHHLGTLKFFSLFHCQHFNFVKLIKVHWRFRRSCSNFCSGANNSQLFMTLMLRGAKIEQLVSGCSIIYPCKTQVALTHFYISHSQ